MHERVDEWDGATAVIAHALLNSMSVISGSMRMLLDGDVPEAFRRQLLERALSQAVHVTGVLQDLVRGLPPGALSALQSVPVEPAVEGEATTT